MDSGSKQTILVIAVVIAIYWLYSEHQEKRDTKNQTIGIVRHFCDSHGGIGEDLTDEVEASHGHFTVKCTDGSSATGFYKDPDLVTFYDRNLNVIE